MNKFFRLLDRFHRDESGAFALIFGVMAIVLVALSGAVVDYVAVEQARNRAQTALDAAILSLQPSIYTPVEAGYTDKVDEIKKKSGALVRQQIADTRVITTVDDAVYDITKGSLRITARINVPMRFMSLLGFNEMEPQIVSEATRQKLHVEVAMILDNSGSMDDHSRMTNLKEAAQSAVKILFDDKPTSSTTSVGIVPFNNWVNIGPSYKTAPWMDKTGISSASHDNFDDDQNDATPFTGPLDRFALYDQISGVSWKGCVESRPQPYDADDSVPDSSVPDTLFVPQFAPDEPSGGSYLNSYLGDDPNSCRTSCSWLSRAHYSGGWKYDNTYTATGPAPLYTVSVGPSACSCPSSYTSDTGWKSVGGGYYERTRTCTISTAGSLSEIEKMERICKYYGSSPGAQSWGDGPSPDCVNTKILPLTNVRKDVDDRIKAMVSNGGTNIHLGTAWGFHMLSPSEPLTEGRAYNSATLKVAIIMTDGENTHYQWGYSTDKLTGSSLFTPYGFPINERLGDGSKSVNQMEALINTRLAQTCTNMKSEGIDVYTIGLNPPNAATRSLLSGCATNTGMAYFPSDPSELKAVFIEIAGQLADLRLAL